MATIGTIGIEFTAETGGIRAGVSDVVSSLTGVQSAADALSSRLSALSDSSIGIKVDTSAFKTAEKEVEKFSAKKKITKAIEIDEEETDKAVEEGTEKAQKKADKKKITLTATIKDSLKEGLDKAKAAADAVVSPITASKSALEGLYGAAKKMSSAFGDATKSASLLRDAVLGVGTGGKALRSLIISATSFSAAWTSAGEGLSATKEGVGGLFEALASLADFGSDSEALTKSLSAAAGAFTATSVTSLAAAASIKLVEAATKDLDPALQKSVRLLAGLGIAAAQTEASKRLAAASSKVFTAALSAEVSPMAAVSSFLSELNTGLSLVAESSQTSARVQALYTEAVKVSQAVVASATATAKAFYGTIASGIKSLSLAAAESGKTAQAAKFLRTVYYDLGIVMFAAGDAVASALNSFAAGRAALSLFTKGVAVLSSAFTDAIGITRAFWSAFSAGVSSLPGASSAIGAISKALGSLGSALGEASKGFGGLKVSLRALGPLFQVAAVATGAYSQQLRAASSSAEEVINLAKRFGTSAGSVELLAQSAEGAGVSMGQLVKAQQTLFQNSSKIKFGQVDSESVREAQLSLARLEISVADIQSLSPDKLFTVVAERLQGIDDAADRAAISFDLFGKAGASILPALAGLEEVRKDAERFGTVTSSIDLSRLEGLDKSFDRLGAASSALAGAFLTPLVPLQTGWNNLLADIKGGLNKLLGPINTFIAAGTVGFQVLFEVIGRVVNILLRLGGAVAEVVTAFLSAPTLAVGWQALGSAIMDVLAVVERLVSFVEKVAGAISSSLTPSVEQLKKTVDITKPAESVQEWGQKLLVAGKYLGIIALSMGVAQAAATSFSAATEGAAVAVATKNAVAAKSFGGLTNAATRMFKLVGGGAIQMAAKYIAAVIVMGTKTIAGFITPFLGAVATFITGSTAIATSSTLTGYAMAAAWVIGTLGIAALIVAIIALVQNFDKVYDYFANFSDNAKNLFTLDGLVDMAKAIGKALWDVFMGIGKAILGWFAGIAQSIADAVMGIEAPEIGNAAKADAEELAETRRKAQEAEYERARKIAELSNTMSRGVSAATFGLGDFGEFEMPEMPVDDTEAVTEAVESSRDAMRGAIVDAAKFGETGKKAALDAQKDFAKLQESLAAGALSPEKFEEEAARIRESLEKNIKDLDVLTDSDLFDFAKTAQDSAKEAQKEVDKIGRGQDLGSTFSKSRFFPTSDEIKEEASKAQKELEARNKDIAKKLAEGGFGEGQEAKDAAAKALADSQDQFSRDMAKIEVDVSFAGEIRKALEDAFLTPADMLDKRLEEIANNKSLTDIEKQQASAMEARKFAEAEFGVSTSEQIAEKRQSLARAVSLGAFDNQPGRADAEGRKLDAQRRAAAGIDDSPAQKLQLGIDKINDAFGTTGLTMAEIQGKLSPEEFAEYTKALKENRDAIRESLGVEKSGADKIAESREKLNQAVKDDIVTREEANKALKKQRDALLSSLGITKSPAQDFEDAVQAIRDNAKELSSEEIAKGLKEAKDKLLSALGIEKSPAQAATESLTKLREAFSKGQITFKEFQEGLQKTRDTLLQSLGIPLDPVNALRDRMNDLQEAFSKRLITEEEFRKGQEEARRSMLPGGESKSPVEQFREDFDAVGRALEEGLITEEDAAQRRLNLQADLQENLRPALDSVGADRRLVGASDVRSKEGVDTFFRILQGRDNPSLKAQQEIARNTRLLAEAAADPDAEPVIAQLSAR